MRRPREKRREVKLWQANQLRRLAKVGKAALAEKRPPNRTAKAVDRYADRALTSYVTK